MIPSSIASSFTTKKRSFAIFTASLLALGLTSLLLLFQSTEAAPGDLSVEILAGYNLVVDSNVESPSTYAPSVATVAGKFCNTSTTETLTNVQGFIGDYNAGTPGLYPQRAVDAAFAAEHPHLDNSIPGDYYAFEHVGGRMGTADATRYVGDLAPGECKLQYWHFTYPRRGNPDNTGNPVWGATRDPNDDLWLQFDIWGEAAGGENDNATWAMTMRNEISAMANKIEPNPLGHWFNTDTSTIRPGSVITSNGILYELGNINQGFDNDGDFVPDYNAWLQPIGDPNYDPSCFRLIRTSGVITVSRSGGKPDMIVPFTDQLYFTNLPPDNTGVIGEVFYSFLALDGPCTTSLTPYQEVASGFDNEKFNGDFGSGIPPVVSLEPQVTVDKSGDATVTTGGTINYSIDFSNNGSDSAGLPLNSTGIVISDSIPAGTALIGLTVPTNATVLYSTDGGQTFSPNQPADLSTVTTIQWWLTEPLAPGASDTYNVSVQAPAAPLSPPIIENCASASFGQSASFAESCTSTRILGSSTIGDFVWQDDNGNGKPDGGETGLNDVTVSLYYDVNGDGTLDDGDLFLESTTTYTNGSSGYYEFANLANGDYLVVVDTADTDLPFGYGNTTATTYSVKGLGTTLSSPYRQADFGFGPILALDKQLVSSSPVSESHEVVYTIEMVNTRPGDGTGQSSSCTYTLWSDMEDVAHSGGGTSSWADPANAFNVSGPDTLFASSNWQNNSDLIAATNFNLANQGGNITAVEALMSIYVAATDGDADGPIENDMMTANLYFNDVLGPSRAFTTEMNAFEGAANQGLLTWNVTAARAWSWSDFSGTFIDFQLNNTKSGGGDKARVYLDGMALRVTTDQACGGAESTLNPVPLTDTYDADKLQFVSAEPAQDAVSIGAATPYANTGVITWDNLGPLYAGQTKVVTVTFMALEPAGNIQTTITNEAAVQNVKFADGRSVHEASDSVTTNLEPTASIGDFIWSDQNGDGVQDPGEPGIPGVTVNLTLPGGSVISTVTDGNGRYQFPGLADGSYTVAVATGTLPGGSASQTGDPDATLDNRATAVIASATDITNMDFGYDNVPAVIFGTVWEDNDGDGTQESGENGLAGVTVELRDGSCTPGSNCPTAVTDTEGNYQFESAGGGSYTIVILPIGGSWTQTDDPDASLDDEHAITINAGDMSGSHDFGYTQSGSYTLGDTIYTDWNGDGAQGSDEPGLNGVVVRLYEDVNGDGRIDPDSDAFIASDTTGTDGQYAFPNLVSGNYLVIVDESTLPAWWDNFARTEDPDATKDGRSPVTLTASDDTIDFGYQPLGAASIGDLVWIDRNRNGYFDTGEAAIADVTVSLYVDKNQDGLIDPAADSLVATTSTDAAGYYLFDYLTAVSGMAYLVQVNTADPQFPTDAYGNPYALTTNANPRLVTGLTGGQAYRDADFGYIAGGSIGDTIWQDNDGNGLQDPDEPGLSGVIVELYEWADTNGDGMYAAADDAINYITNDTTDANGVYQFNSLEAGDYVVLVTGVSLSQTSDPDRLNPCADSSRPLDPACDEATGVELSAGQIFMAADFGYRPVRTLGDYVWLDVNGDGVQDADEPGLGGVLIELTQPGGGVVTTTTDGDGFYSFGGSDLSADGTYQITVDTATLPSAAMVATYDLDATLDDSASYTFNTGVNGNVDTVDFGYRYDGAYSISGTVFFDSGADGGAYSSGTDTPYANIEVYLWDGNGRRIGTTTTDSSGAFSFGNLPGGGVNYTVSLNPDSPQLGGLTLTAHPAESGACTICNNYNTDTINAASITGQDFGFYAATDFGDLAASYATLLADEGPYHTTGSLYLGSSVSTEGDGMISADSTADTFDDGVTRSLASLWMPGATVSLTINVTGGPGRVGGWFDWNGDGDFFDAGEFVDFGLRSGSSTGTITVPAASGYSTGDPLNVRFRVFAPAGIPGGGLDAGDFLGQATNGEVEDYQWLFGPTAVSLANIQAGRATAVPILGLLLFISLAGFTGLRLRKRSK